MNQFRLTAMIAVASLVGVLPAAAQGKSASHGGGAAAHGRPTPSTGATSAGKSGDAHTRGQSGEVTRGKSSDARPAKTKSTKAGKSDDAAETSKSGERSSSSSAGRAASGADGVAAKISHNPEQLARVTAMLPSGMTLDQAAAGFRNQGQFIAALNASKNQGVSFTDLQKAMTQDGLSLGQAVRKLKPQAPSATESGSTTPTKTTTASTTTSAS